MYASFDISFPHQRQDVAMELYTEYVYRTLNSFTTNVRVRLKIVADPYFNPVRCTFLQCVAVCGSVLQCVAVS